MMTSVEWCGQNCCKEKPEWNRVTRSVCCYRVWYCSTVFVLLVVVSSATWMVVAMIILPPAMRDTASEYRAAQDAQPCVGSDTALASYCTATLKGEADDVNTAADATEIMVVVLLLTLVAWVSCILAIDWYTQRPFL